MVITCTWDTFKTISDKAGEWRILLETANGQEIAFKVTLRMIFEMEWDSTHMITETAILGSTSTM